jgi:outer membrane lipoprotein-sorting protein
MKKIAVIVMAAALAGPAFAGKAFAGQELSMTYDQVMTTSKGVFVTKVWIKGNRKRTETDRPSGQEIDIIQGSIYIQIFPDLGIARKLSLATGAGSSTMPPMPANLGGGKSKGKDGKETEDSRPIGTETVANLPCKVYEIKREDGCVTRVWISDILPFPVKWEEDEKHEGKFSYEIRNLKVSADIPDDLFEVPADVKLMD